MVLHCTHSHHTIHVQIIKMAISKCSLLDFVVMLVLAMATRQFLSDDCRSSFLLRRISMLQNWMSMGIQPVRYAF